MRWLDAPQPWNVAVDNRVWAALMTAAELKASFLRLRNVGAAVLAPPGINSSRQPFCKLTINGGRQVPELAAFCSAARIFRSTINDIQKTAGARSERTLRKSRNGVFYYGSLDLGPTQSL
jgi:hypothetical protein